MSDRWMTVAESAAALKVHPRTIERRIAAGRIQSRRADDGQVQVLIAAPDMPDNELDPAFATVRDLAVDQITLAKGSASALVKFAQEDANRARDEVYLVRRDVGRARRSALIAWCVVAAVGIGLCIAVGWTAQKIAKANSDVQHLNDYAQKMEEQSRLLIAERDKSRDEAQTAKLAAAESAGRLEVYAQQALAHPTTRPTNLAARIASVFAGD
jgi:outer membrane murein-binding lipoprotein Lpp